MPPRPHDECVAATYGVVLFDDGGELLPASFRVAATAA
jgi:hypothetical protein